MDPVRWKGELTRAGARVRDSFTAAPPMSSDSPHLRLGILGIVLVLIAGLLLMLPVKAKQAVID